MVARAPVPLLRDACRTELNKAERNIGSYKYMAVSACSDLRVDIGSEIVNAVFWRATEQKQCRK